MASRSKYFYFVLVISSIWALSIAEEHEMVSMDVPDGVSGVTGDMGLAVDAKLSAVEFLQMRKGKVSKKGLKIKGKKGKKKKLKVLKKPMRAARYKGSFPSAKLKSNADEIARKFLAKQKLLADRKERKWQMKVLKVKVNKAADQMLRKKNKRVKKKLKKAAKLKKQRKKSYKAKLKAIKFKDTANIDEDHIVNSDERAKKAVKELNIAASRVRHLRDMKGHYAKADKKAAQVLLSKIRIARAHADKTIIGLTPEQKKNPAYLSLHQAITVAAGDPTDSNLKMAERQVKVTQAAVVKEKKYKIWKAKDVVVKEKKGKRLAERKKKEIKAKAAEKKKKKKMEKKLKEKTRKAKVEQAAKRRKEVALKKVMKERRKKWKKKQEKIMKKRAKERKKKGGERAKKAKANELKKKLGSAFGNERCRKIALKKQKAMEKRRKAIGAQASARAANARKSTANTKLRVKNTLNKMRERNVKLSRTSSNLRVCIRSTYRRRRCVCNAARRRRAWYRRRRYWSRRRRWWYRRRRWSYRRRRSWGRRRRRVALSLVQTSASRGRGDRPNRRDDNRDAKHDRQSPRPKNGQPHRSRVLRDSASAKDNDTAQAGWGRRRRRWVRRRVWTRRRWMRRRYVYRRRSARRRRYPYRRRRRRAAMSACCYRRRRAYRRRRWSYRRRRWAYRRRRNYYRRRRYNYRRRRWSYRRRRWAYRRRRWSYRRRRSRGWGRRRRRVSEEAMTKREDL